jgi:O-antigen/teichoic acid export membrane protein
MMSKSVERAPQLDGRLRPDTLAASVAVLLVANLVQRSVGFGRGVLFCRWLSPDELGAWDLAYSFLLLAAPVVVLGLPGCFGRYLERFRQRGQLRTFLRRATVWTASLTIAAIAMMIAAAPLFSNLIFGRPDQNTSMLILATGLPGTLMHGYAAIALAAPQLGDMMLATPDRHTTVVILAASLAAVILHHYLEAVFAALRKFTIVSSMHFCQSLLFAAISLALLWSWRFDAESIVIGYGAACLLSAVFALVWKGGALVQEVPLDAGMPHREFWPPLVRFAIWIWVTNFLCHLFAVVDRYMLVHWSGLENAEALALVGHYHASRIIPLLFLSVADLLTGVVTPYLSHDWEAGGRQRVSDH